MGSAVCDDQAGMSCSERFSIFYEENHSEALRYVKRRFPVGDHEGIVADAFLVAWEKILAGLPIGKPWFYRVLQNKMGDQMRLARYRVCCDPDSCRFPAVPDPAAAVDVRECLRKLLGELRVEHAQVLWLVYVQDMTSVDAASVLRIPAGTFRKRLERARAAFLLKLRDVREG